MIWLAAMMLMIKDFKAIVKINIIAAISWPPPLIFTTFFTQVF